MSERKEIYLAGGCFWGTEKFFALMEGVTATAVGYANGATENPSYEDVCRRNTGHAETVRVEYNPSEIQLTELLDLYYKAIDPTSVNKQGGDIGTQYRTGIYYVDANDLPIIDASIKELATHYEKPIAIEVLPLENFYLAEEYHQNYFYKNPTGYCHISAATFELSNNHKNS